MSKIGKKPITIPEAVQVSVAQDKVIVKGPKGELAVPIHRKVKVEQADGEIKVSVPNPEDKRQRALWGTMRALINNAVVGVKDGFEKKLEILGVGYKAAVSGSKLVLSLGFSHPVEMEIPEGLNVALEKNTITVSGSSRQAVGEFAATVRSKRKPEPYKGKGIKYAGEVIRRKAGKVVKAVGG